MTISFDHATSRLLSGNELSWHASGPSRAGSITLSASGQRRLLKYFLSSNNVEVAQGSDRIFGGIIKAWTDEDSDPTPSVIQIDPAERGGPWRLQTIETTNFGGLNTYDGPTFRLEVEGENWCLEGSNGSGKTLLASAIIWVLTGYLFREQDGLTLETGARTPVFDGSGKKIGSWPALVTYPQNAKHLRSKAIVTVTLVFADPSGNQALARRTLVSPAIGNPEITIDVDPRLTASTQLIETGLLMPARLSHIGFGSKSASLYEAMKALTGLDRLADIALGASAICNRGRRFLKYSKDQGINRFKTKFETEIGKARELSGNTQLKISKEIGLGEKKLLANLDRLCQEASSKAGKLLASLGPETVKGLDLSTIEGRQLLSKAVHTAQGTVESIHKEWPLFHAWAALKEASANSLFHTLPDKLPEFDARLNAALKWHAKQQVDRKLRLKALASSYFVPFPESDVSPTCPLCEQPLDGAHQRALAAELKALKTDAKHAERKIDDACSDITKELRAMLPSSIQNHFDRLATMSPAADFRAAALDRLVTSPPFSSVLVGIANALEHQISSQTDALPVFRYPAYESTGNPEPPSAADLREFVHKVHRIVALADWWAKHHPKFANCFATLIGRSDNEDQVPPESLRGMLKALEDANDKAEPLDRFANHLRDVKDAATEWNRIYTEQKTREAIAAALEPFKKLKHLVDAETYRTINSLSDRVSKITDEIRLKERLEFGNAELQRNQVTVHGHFARDYRVNAGLVANASWLRAVLWAFIFAMRDQVIHDHARCDFPLMVLDDPQLTFDPKNKRKWAEKIVELANADTFQPNGFQLFLTTHERQFFDIITGTCALNGQKGMIARPHKDGGVTQILNGSKLDRLFAQAQTQQSSETSQGYIRAVRVYCEDLLRIMLRPESYELTTNTLGALTNVLTKYHREGIPPYNRPVFKRLATNLRETGNQPVVYMNATSHTDDGTIGFAQAEDVQRYWKDKLQKCFSDAFMLAADYDAYADDPRLYAYPDTVIQFPTDRSNAIAQANLLKTGIAAAAESDGLVGDGAISIEEWEASHTLNLQNHSAYLVSASTLEPVVTVGDIVLVKNHGKPNARNLVVAAHGDRFLARRLNLPEDHPGMAILTGQSTTPYALPQPVISPLDKISMRKIVGTVFQSNRHAPQSTTGEVVPVSDATDIAQILEGTRLFLVSGRSMEPIALDNQFVITRERTINVNTLASLEGQLIIGIDENGTKYFKRMRRHARLILLESANSDAWTTSAILSTDGKDYPALTNILSVVGVLFEEP